MGSKGNVSKKSQLSTLEILVKISAKLGIKKKPHNDKILGKESLKT